MWVRKQKSTPFKISWASETLAYNEMHTKAAKKVGITYTDRFHPFLRVNFLEFALIELIIFGRGFQTVYLNPIGSLRTCQRWLIPTDEAVLLVLGADQQ